ncbi:hypothetical protein QR685DRAFT_155601 [Neurospora intermedia]|uniref:Uncharacterized protein n=1 Tax=Neurospora intermedia TaxID=5142 RepID=A0ABR3DJN0_NEUIN
MLDQETESGQVSTYLRLASSRWLLTRNGEYVWMSERARVACLFVCSVGGRRVRTAAVHGKNLPMPCVGRSGRISHHEQSPSNRTDGKSRLLMVGLKVVSHAVAEREWSVRRNALSLTTIYLVMGWGVADVVVYFTKLFTVPAYPWPKDTVWPKRYGNGGVLESGVLLIVTHPYRQAPAPSNPLPHLVGFSIFITNFSFVATNGENNAKSIRRSTWERNESLIISRIIQSSPFFSSRNLT